MATITGSTVTMVYWEELHSAEDRHQKAGAVAEIGDDLAGLETVWQLVTQRPFGGP